MQLKNILESQSLKDFSSLFLSNIFQKLLGLIRELVIAFFLGSSILYANFLLLRVVADFFSQLTAGNALKANLLPKFTKIYKIYKEVSLDQVFVFSRKNSIYFFLISQLIQTGVIFYLNLAGSLQFFIISIILSLSISLNFINTIFLTIFQARGFFLKYSYASITNSMVFTILVYPLISFASIIGLVISRLIGILSLSFAFIRPMRNSNRGVEMQLTSSDFNFPTLVLGNFANIIIISSRFISGMDGSNNITFFMYSVVILNVILTSVIGNISTILLRKISINKNVRFMIYSLLVSLLVGVSMIIFLYFFSYDIIEFIYLRGAFNILDVQQTSVYLYELAFSFVLLFMTTILFQPFLSLPISETKDTRMRLFVLFILGLFLSFCIVLFPYFSAKEASLFVVNITSVIALFLSIYSYIKYLRYEQ
ncbi:MAG: hypothetical protein CMD16_02740 [Flavobacteriales bacterium]|nr:hypothetical protein [Flavobacteriales bacterium]|tara:strand:+ start:56190 stop:57461 length:1272 start_codon:yes stop_codon:yes gene_type:complete